MTSGSLTFHGNRIVLTLPPSIASTTPGDNPDASQSADLSFSRQFMTAAVESMATMREWASTLAVAIQNGFPLTSGIARYRSRAMESVRLASAAVSTTADRDGLQLLTNELNNVEAWSSMLVEARKSMSAAKFAMSEETLRADPQSQKILNCAQDLGPMLASGTFQDITACH
jgi:hypothetical protein